MKPVSLKKLESVAVAALKDIKAQNITVLNVRELTPLYDLLIIASAQSARQTKALANLVREKVKAVGGTIVGVEGEEAGEWVLVDCGDLVVHIMQPAIREYYNLEALWTPPVPVRKAAPDKTSADAPIKKAKKTARKSATSAAKTASKKPAKTAAKSSVKKPAKKSAKKISVSSAKKIT
ncbi:MAG: ribosome silencing factor [Burkholderiales bacterium]|nr:ribosome silencing factor [Burkholderiales bacterium]